MKLLDKLPKSYAELPLEKYIKIINTLPAERPEDMTIEDWNLYLNLTILSILLDTTTAELERLPAAEIINLLRSISFLEVPLKSVKTRLKTKDIKELSYDEFVNFQKLRLDMWNNINEIMKILIKGDVPENISVQEAYNIFFCLKKSIQKFMNYSLISLGWKIIRLKMKEKLKLLLPSI